MPRKVFTAGEVLAASDVNDFLMDQTVMTFAGTAARGSAIPTPAEGMYAHLNDTDTLSYYDGSAWVNRLGAPAGILQVVSVTKTDTFFTSSATQQDIPDLTLTVTPASASSKFLVLGKIPLSQTDNNGAFVFLKRNGTDVAVGNADGSRLRAYDMSTGGNSGYDVNTVVINSLDSPATASAVTYKVTIRRGTAGNAWVNRVGADVDNEAYGRLVSTLTVMEVAG